MGPIEPVRNVESSVDSGHVISVDLRAQCGDRRWSELRVPMELRKVAIDICLHEGRTDG